MIYPLTRRATLRTGACKAAIFAGLLIAPSAAFAQEEDAEPDAEPTAVDVTPSNAGEIVVRAERLRGQLDVEQAPLLELDAQQIAAEGVASIGDLVTQITNQTGSSRGRGGGPPVILINGIRVGSFREFFQYPPEAVARAEVFSEEVAQRFGFPPDQRIINLVLKENFSSREVEFEYEGPSRGGYTRTEQELGYLKITDGGRINLNFEANDTSLLTEDERGILQTPGSQSELAGDPDQAPFRSLIADSRQLEGNISWAKAFLDSGTAVSASLNYNRNDSLALNGLNTVVLTDPLGNSLVRTFGEETPLQNDFSSDRLAASGSLTKSVNGLQLTSTFDASLLESENRIDQRFDTSTLIAQAATGDFAIDGALPVSADAGIDIANSRNIAGTSQTTLRGPIAYLPGGDLTATFDVGLNWQRIESSDTRSLLSTELTRREISTGANLVVPITSRRNGFADALGSFTLNLQAGLEDLSDFGLLGDYTVGLTWSPFDNLDLTTNYVYREVSPSLQALGNPEVTTFNVPVFDFTTGETVLAAVTTGGNPDLRAETQRDWKFGANWELPFWENTRLSVDYVLNTSNDVTRGFPVISAATEAAFPDRVTRDSTGRLVALDRRFVTYEETNFRRLQFNLFTRGRFGQPEREERGEGRGRGGARAGGPPPGAGGPPTEEQRAQFREMRTKICADDGLAYLTRLVEAVEKGEDLSAEFPGVDPERLKRMLERVHGEDGKITEEELATFRERFCAMDPAMFAGRGGPPAGEGDGDGAGGPGPAFAALREKICGEDGAEVLAQLIARIEAGEDVSADLPGVNPAMLKPMLDRLRGEDGKISPEALERFRTRVCEGGQGGQQGGGINPRAFFGGGRNQGWGYFISLNHTINLESEVLIAQGLDPLDELDGDAFSAFGLPRHNSRLEAGLFGQGLGFRLSGQYTGKTQLNGSATTGSSDIFFDDLVTFDLRVFSNLGELTGKNEGFLKNLRVSLRADNIFDARRRITDANGDTPINYQPLLIDPTGLYLGIDIRKLF